MLATRITPPRRQRAARLVRRPSHTVVPAIPPLSPCQPGRRGLPGAHWDPRATPPLWVERLLLVGQHAPVALGLAVRADEAPRRALCHGVVRLAFI
eukprot:12923560-Alexandrium_andersonii.AAC.1